MKKKNSYKLASQSVIQLLHEIPSMMLLYTHVWSSKIIAFLLTCPTSLLQFRNPLLVISLLYLSMSFRSSMCLILGQLNVSTNADLAETAAPNAVSFLELRPLGCTVNKDFRREIFRFCACLNSSASLRQSNGHGVHTHTWWNGGAQQNYIPNVSSRQSSEFIKIHW